MRCALADVSGAPVALSTDPAVANSGGYFAGGGGYRTIGCAENTVGVRFPFADAMDTVPSATNWLARTSRRWRKR